MEESVCKTNWDSDVIQYWGGEKQQEAEALELMEGWSVCRGRIKCINLFPIIMSV